MNFNIRRCLILILVMLNLLHTVISQNNRIDSLQEVLRNEKNDTLRAQIQDKICFEYISKGDFQRALQIAQSNLKLVENLNYKKGTAYASLTMGIVYANLEQYEEAAKYLKAASACFHDMNNLVGFATSNYELASIHYYQSDYHSALKYLDTALLNSKKSENKQEIGKCYNLRGEIHFRMGNYKESLSDYSASLKLFEEINDKIEIADVYNNIANIYQDQGQNIKALENYYSAIKIYESIGDKPFIAGLFINIGGVYDSQQNFEESLSSYRKGLKIGTEINSKKIIASALSNIGITLSEQNKNKEAIDTLKIAFGFHKELGDLNSMTENCNNMGQIYYTLGEFKESEKSYRSAMNMSAEVGNKLSFASSCLNIGQLFIKLNQPDSSRKYLLDGIQIVQQLGALEYLQRGFNNLYELNLFTGDYKNALEYFKKYTECKDSILNEKKSKQLAEMKEKFETEQKDHQIQLQNIDLQKQKQRNNFLIGFLLLFAVISFLIYREYANRHKIKLQELRNKIASDLHDDVGSTLSSISIFSQIAQERPSEVQSLLQTIEDSSRKMLDAMADIVWTIKPENDDFEKIILRMRSFAYELLGAKQIEFRFVVDKNASNINIPMDARKNLYLIFKEATNNLVKYSNATKAEFKITTEQANLVINIKDNGSGFESTKEFMGNGLKNMKARAKEIGALLSIDSETGIGTNIQIKLAI